MQADVIWNQRGRCFSIFHWPSEQLLCRVAKSEASAQWISCWALLELQWTSLHCMMPAGPAIATAAGCIHLHILQQSYTHTSMCSPDLAIYNLI